MLLKRGKMPRLKGRCEEKEAEIKGKTTYKTFYWCAGSALAILQTKRYSYSKLIEKGSAYGVRRANPNSFNSAPKDTIIVLVCTCNLS